ncbi:MAG: hypothetical protein GY820_17210 [Gammaproteobacteria bacterium]|nr:hypothetical protein [Gammaproteobacteria bacterium]
MIQPSDIVTQLQTYLPRVTDLFNNTIDATSATIGASNIMTVVTPSAHGLSVGSTLTVRSGLIEVSIVDFILGSDDTILFECSTDHDLTEPKRVNDLTEIELDGFTDSSWNGTFEIDRVPNRLNFSINVPDGASAPVLNGNEVLRIERTVSVFGIRSVATVPDTTTLTVDLGTDVPDMTGLSLYNLSIVTGVRISAVATIERATDIYTKNANNELWCFVIMTDVDVSKDRHSISDAFLTATSQNEMRLRLMQNFSLLVFIPTSDNLAGENAQELAYGDVYRSLLSVLYGYGGFTKSEDQSNFIVVNTGHGREEYNKAYYIHVYDWQLAVDINSSNGFNFFESVAFRNIGGTLPINTLDNEEQLTLTINLDDEPL